MFNGIHLSRAPETRLDFVINQHNAVLFGDLPQLLQKLVWGRNEAAFAEDWLDDNCGNLLRRDLGFKDVLQTIQGALCTPPAISIGKWCVINLWSERPEILLIRARFPR